jgi:hypothetical protein
MSLPYSPTDKNDDFLNLMAEYFGIIIQDLTGADIQNAAVKTTVETNIVATIFKAFNQYIWLIAMFLLVSGISYAIFQRAKKLETPKEGVDQFNVITATILLMPTKWGFSIVGVMLISIALWSINAANSIAYTGISNLFQTTTAFTLSSQLFNTINFKEVFLGATRIQLCRFSQHALFSHYDLNNFASSTPPPQLMFGDPISPINLSQIYSNYTVAPFFSYVNSTASKVSNAEYDIVTQPFSILDAAPTQLPSSCGSINWSYLLANPANATEKSSIAFMLKALDPQITQVWQTQFNQLMRDLDATLRTYPNLAKPALFNSDTTATAELVAKLQTLFAAFETQSITQLQETVQNDEAVKAFLKLKLASFKERGLLSLIGFRQELAAFKTELISLAALQRFQIAPPIIRPSGQAQIDALMFAVQEKHQNFIDHDLMLNSDLKCSLALPPTDVYGAQALSDLRSFILNRLGIVKDPRCAASSQSIDAVSHLQELAMELTKIADSWQKNMKAETGKALNPEMVELPKKLKDLQIWFGSLLPMTLDLFLLFAMVAFMLRLVGLMLGASVWAASLLLPGNKTLGSAPILKEAVQLAVYLPVITATYFLIQALLNVILPKSIYLILAPLKFNANFDLDSLKWSMMGFSVVCAAISLMILQLIFTIPQLIAKLLNYSETDFGAGYGVNKIEGHLNTKMGGGGAGGNTKDQPIKSPVDTTRIKNSEEI